MVKVGQVSKMVALLGAIVLITSGCAWMRLVTEPTTDSFPEGTISASEDGRYIAWDAMNGPTWLGDAQWGVFLLDSLTEAREVVSVSSTGELANSWSADPSISEDGRFIAFISDASNLVSDDFNNTSDVFLRDRVAQTTVRVSVTTDEDEVGGASWSPAISANGQRIAFESESDEFDIIDDNDQIDIFLRDITAGTTAIMSIGADDLVVEGGAWGPAISGDGKVVSFTSESPLVPADTNELSDVYLRVPSVSGGITQWVSRPRANAPAGSGGGMFPSLSRDGSLVAFQSGAPNMVAGLTDTLDQLDVFLRNRSTNTTELVSMNAVGALMMGNSQQPIISADGSKVLYVSEGDPTGTDSNGGLWDVFVRNRILARTTVVSTGLFLGQMQAGTFNATLTPDGSYALFMSVAPFFPSDENLRHDIYMRAVDVPSVYSISPTMVSHGETVTFTVTGDTFQPGAQLLMPVGFTVGTTVVTPTSLVVQLTVTAAAPVGDTSVVVQNPGTGPGYFTGAVGGCPKCLMVHGH